MHVSLDSALGRQRRLNSVGESVLQIAPNAAAAYSLRSLTGGSPKVVRVRRASDNGERDFTSAEINSGEMVSWVNQQAIAPLDIQALEADGRTGDFLIAKAAYSLRSLGTRQATLAATGDTVARANGKFVVQVRRSSDDALKSFTADEVTDGTLLAFVGTGGSDNGFVKTWYDQSVTNEAGDTATGNHATQATAASQPKIVSAGSYLGEVDFTSSSTTLGFSSIAFGTTYSFFLAAPGLSESNFKILSDGGGAPRIDYEFSSPDKIEVVDNDFGNTKFNTDNTFAQLDNLTSIINASTTTSLFFNGNASSTNTFTLPGANTYNTIGGIAAGAVFEVVLYGTDQTDNRVALETNINSQYSIF